MKPRPRVTLLNAMADTQLFSTWFRDPASWVAWRAFVAALFALPMSEDQAAIYRACTGRNEPPTTAASEAWLVCGRRAGKSFILALIAVFLACFHDYRIYLSPGERGTVIVIATDRRQARVIIRYIRGLLSGVPMLARLIERETAESFDLANGITIEVGTASFKSVRGYTIVAALLDELAFFPSDDAAEPDHELINALEPGMATIPGAMLLMRIQPLRAAGGTVGRTPEALRPGRRPGTGMAIRHAHNESERAAARDRRGDGARSSERGGRVRSKVPFGH